MNWGEITVLILDVDGVLTDGAIAYNDDGNQVLYFDVQDGHAIHLWRQCGRRVGLLSGRGSDALRRRAAELKVDALAMNVGPKLPAYQQMIEELGAKDAEVAFVGDDTPDLAPMSRVALPVAVLNAVPAVKRAARYVTRRPGGSGAVAEVIDLILRKQRPAPGFSAASTP